MSTDFEHTIWECALCHKPFTPQEWMDAIPQYLGDQHSFQLFGKGLYHPECVQPAKVAARLGT